MRVVYHALCMYVLSRNLVLYVFCYTPHYRTMSRVRVDPLARVPRLVCVTHVTSCSIDTPFARLVPCVIARICRAVCR